MAFALTSGSFSNPAIWDIGVVPTGSEDCYANGFNVTIDGTQSVGTIRNSANPYVLGNTAVKGMTSNTLDGVGGVVSSNLVSTAFQVFDNNITTAWTTNVNPGTGWIGFNFLTPKVIKRYYFRPASNGTNSPLGFSFDGSDDGINWVTLDSRLSQFQTAPFTSGLINTGNTPYSFYRLFIVRSGSGGSSPSQIFELEMTENPSTTAIVSSQLNGGKFLTGSGSTLTCTDANGIRTYNVINNIPVLECALPSGQTATVNANVSDFGSTVVGTVILITLTNTGTLNMNGNFVNSNVGTNTTSRTFQLTAAGTLTIVGSVSLTSVAVGNPNILVINNAGNATVNIIGTITTAGGNVGTQQTISQTGGRCNVTGTVVGGTNTNNVGINATGGEVNITGNVTASGGRGITFTSNAALTVNGVVTASSSSPAIVSTSIGVVQMSGPFINNAGVQAVQATRLFLNTTSTFWRINTAAGVQRQFSTTDYNGGYPGIPNVRDGVVFGELSEFTGELIIPPTGSVRKDVPVDNTVGTAELTSADFLAAIDASTSGIGLRLKNVATVASVGAQITGFTNN